MPRLAQTGACLQARARENGISPLMRCSSSPKFLSLGLLFPKTSCLGKGMRKGEKQSFKKTLNYFSGQLSKSASHSRVKKCFCLTFSTHRASVNSYTSKWLSIQDRKHQVPRADFVLCITIPIYWNFNIEVSLSDLSDITPTSRTQIWWFNSLNQRTPCSFTSHCITLTMLQKLPLLQAFKHFIDSQIKLK